MKSSKRQVRRLGLGVGIFSCLVFNTGCKDALQLQADWEHTTRRVEELYARSQELEGKLMDLRRAMPGGTTPEEAGRRMALHSEASIKLIEKDIEQAKARLSASEKALADLKRSVTPSGS